MNALGLREVAKQQADQTNRKESQPHRERVPVPELTCQGLISLDSDSESVLCD
jgi:hypothetical protein